MRSPVDRRTGEWLARALVLGALAMLLWRNWTPARGGESAVVSREQLADALVSWSLSPSPERIDLRLAQLPGPVERDWLRALQRTGARIAWRGRVDAPALEINATAEPHPAYLVRIAGAAGERVNVGDDARTIGEVSNSTGTAVLRVATLVSGVSARTRTATAHSPLPSLPAARRVAVFGSAGWETKFVIAALEESGWGIDARIPVAPGVVVGNVTVAPLDTARHSVAMVIDAVESQSIPDLTRFARAGGGVVIAGRAVRSASAATLLPARVAVAFDARDTTIVSPAALGGTTLALSPQAVALEQRGAGNVVAAARFGLGRVAAVGYFDTWRWRMQGGKDAVAAHREWWSALAAAVAYAPDTATVDAPESAPLARFVAALGPAYETSTGGATRQVPFDALLFAVAVLGLLAEVASRRTRGLV